MSSRVTESRRTFITQSAATMVLGAAGCAVAPHLPARDPAPVAGNPPPPRSAVEWDDSWFRRLAVPHKAMFEQSEPDNGSATTYAVRYLQGIQEALRPATGDVRVVLVLRHSAVPHVLDDEMWERYAIGEDKKVKAANGEWATHNPMRVTRAAERFAPGSPQPSLTWLLSNGHIVLGCNLALNNNAMVWAKRTNQDATAVYEELKRHLIPGVILQPNGIYAMHRAQEAGCTAIRCP